MFHNVIVAIYIGVGIWEDSFSNMRGQCLEYELEFSIFFLLVTVFRLLEINRLLEELAQLLTKKWPWLRLVWYSNTLKLSRVMVW